MNVIDLLNHIPFLDFTDPTVKRIALRAVTFTVVALYFTINALTILLRAIIGPRDSQVVSQFIAKVMLVTYLVLLAWNYWGGGSASIVVFDTVRVLMMIAAIIGIPISLFYLWRAIQDLAAWVRERRSNQAITKDGLP